MMSQKTRNVCDKREVVHNNNTTQYIPGRGGSRCNGGP